MFFIGYLFFEVPSNLILERVGARVWIARILILWGSFPPPSCTWGRFPRPGHPTATGFYLLRFLLGMGEAGFFPGIILYLTYWFPSAYESQDGHVHVRGAANGRARRPGLHLDHEDPGGHARARGMAMAVSARGAAGCHHRLRDPDLPRRRSEDGQVAEPARPGTGADEPGGRSEGQGQHGRAPRIPPIAR